MGRSKNGVRATPVCHPDKVYQARGMCKACYTKQWRIKNPDTRCQKDKNARARYGLTKEEYSARREKQKLEEDDLCGVCRKTLGEDANLDHCHVTKRIGKFLHKNCNSALGLLKDDPNICRLAAEYLERYR